MNYWRVNFCYGGVGGGVCENKTENIYNCIPIWKQILRQVCIVQRGKKKREEEGKKEILHYCYVFLILYLQTLTPGELDDNFVCSVCGYQCTTKQNLKSHQKGAHKMGEPFSCQCGFVSWWERALKRHRNRKACSSCTNNQWRKIFIMVDDILGIVLYWQYDRFCCKFIVF